jgi:hypothetical protein
MSGNPLQFAILEVEINKRLALTGGPFVFSFAVKFYPGFLVPCGAV